MAVRLAGRNRQCHQQSQGLAASQAQPLVVLDINYAGVGARSAIALVVRGTRDGDRSAIRLWNTQWDHKASTVRVSVAGDYILVCRSGCSDRD